MKTRKGKKSEVTNTKKKQTDSKSDSEESYTNNTMEGEDTLNCLLESDNNLLNKRADTKTQISKRNLRKPVDKNRKLNNENQELRTTSKSKSKEETTNLNDDESNKRNEDVADDKPKVEKSQKTQMKRKMKSVNENDSLDKDHENKEDGESDFDKTKKTLNSKKRKEQNNKIRKGENENDESDSASSTEYEVEKLVDVYFKKDGKREFLVRWKGYSSKHDTWEPEKNLNCQELIGNFIKKCEKARALPVREMRISRRQTDRYIVNAILRGRKLSSRLKHRPRKTYFENI